MPSPANWSLASLMLIVVWAANGAFALVNLAAEAPEHRADDTFALDVVWVPAVTTSPTALAADRPERRRDTARICRAWGPFDAAAEAEALARELGIAAGDYLLFEEATEQRHDHLVRVRSPGSRETAQRVRQELLEHGIDSYLLQPGDFGQALAAGVFASTSRAEAHQRRLLDLGYDAVVESLEQRRFRYHLLARVSAHLVAENTPGRACGEIAPAPRFL
jgi:hypothetical protein